jgi:hypothetical protein
MNDAFDESQNFGSTLASLYPLQIIDHFKFSRLDIVPMAIGSTKNYELKKPKRLMISNDRSMSERVRIQRDSEFKYEPFFVFFFLIS